MSGTAAAFAVGNVVSSVTLVLVNKLAFSAGFKFPITLSFCHFIFTVVFYRLLRCAGFYEDAAMPQLEKFKVALAGFASIGFMNLSLNSNSVGFYQITKLTIIPVVLAINLLYGVHTNGKIKLALLILLAGVGVATVTDVQLRPIGLVYGALAVLTTAVFQIWQGSKQKEFSMSGTQLQAAVAPWMAAQSLAVAAAAEGVCWKPDGSCPKLVQDFVLEAAASDDGVRTLGLVLATCFLALAVNFCSFGLIGRTSPITFQVVGHLKTCLVLVGGYVLFTGQAHPQAAAPEQHRRRLGRDGRLRALRPPQARRLAVAGRLLRLHLPRADRALPRRREGEGGADRERAGNAHRTKVRWACVHARNRTFLLGALSVPRSVPERRAAPQHDRRALCRRVGDGPTPIPGDGVDRDAAPRAEAALREELPHVQPGERHLAAPPVDVGHALGRERLDRRV